MSFLSMSRPARSAGLALLAIALIAAVVGGIMLATGDGGENVAEQPPSSSPGAGPPPGGATTSPGAQPSSPRATSRPPSTGESSAPGGGTSTPGPGEPDTGGTNGGTGGTNGGTGGTGGGSDTRAPQRDVNVRVYNNSNIQNLASRAARDLQGQGWTVAEVSNYPHGVIPATTAYYRKGTQEKAAALSLAAAFGMRAKPRFDGIKDASPGVIIIVTKDYDGPAGKSS